MAFFQTYDYVLPLSPYCPYVSFDLSDVISHKQPSFCFDFYSPPYWSNRFLDKPHYFPTLACPLLFTPSAYLLSLLLRITRSSAIRLLVSGANIPSPQLPLRHPRLRLPIPLSQRLSSAILSAAPASTSYAIIPTTQYSRSPPSQLRCPAPLSPSLSLAPQMPLSLSLPLSPPLFPPPSTSNSS